MSSLKRARVVALATIAFQAAAPAAVEVLTAHFRVVSVLEPGSAEAAAGHLETVHRRIENLGFQMRRPPSPRIEVILFSSPGQMLRYAPLDVQDDSNSAGFFTPGAGTACIWSSPGTLRVAPGLPFLMSTSIASLPTKPFHFGCRKA